MSTALLFRLPLATFRPSSRASTPSPPPTCSGWRGCGSIPAEMTVVVVGDLAKIRAGIEKLGLGPVEVQTYEK